MKPKLTSKERRKERRELWTYWMVRARLAGIKREFDKSRGIGHLVEAVKVAEGKL